MMLVQLIVTSLLINYVTPNLLSTPTTNEARFSRDSTQASVNVTTPTTSDEALPCHFAPGLTVGSRSREIQCCEEIVETYERNWSIQSLPLTRYLATLKRWNCSHFRNECKRRLFAFNEFTALVYDYFCDYENYTEHCSSIFKSTIISSSPHRQQNATSSTHLQQQYLANGNTESGNIQSHTTLLNNISLYDLTLNELLHPCIQVVEYELAQSSGRPYQEIITSSIPFCELTWCGLSGDSYENMKISTWTCMITSCSVKIIVVIVICIILALIITLVNLTVILVIARTPGLHNSQAIYKISLAVADLFVGVFVFPTGINNLILRVMTPYPIGKNIQVRGYDVINGSLSDNWTTVNTTAIPSYFELTFARNYGWTVGFFTSVSLFVSVYVLTAAGFDRLKAVCMPFKYRKEQALKNAKFACLAAWIVAVFFAVLPFFVAQAEYGLLLSFLVASTDIFGVILYIIGLLLPLVVVWIVNIVIFTTIKKQLKNRIKLMGSEVMRTEHATTQQQKVREMEENLARTLLIMVGVFTVNTLPLMILLVGSLFISNVLLTDPRNFDPTATLIYEGAEFVAFMFLLSNSFWNFFIYSARNMVFKKAVSDMYASIPIRDCLVALYRALASCCQKAASTSRRRMSSLPGLPSLPSALKATTTPATLDTNVQSKFSTHNMQGQSSSVLQSSSQGSENVFRNNSTSLKSDNGSSEIQQSELGEKKQNNKKKTNQAPATDDSVFGSFAIVENNLFNSVVGNMDDKTDQKISEESV